MEKSEREHCAHASFAISEGEVPELRIKRRRFGGPTGARASPRVRVERETVLASCGASEESALEWEGWELIEGGDGSG